jgi:hypothetical protein
MQFMMLPFNTLTSLFPLGKTDIINTFEHIVDFLKTAGITFLLFILLLQAGGMLFIYTIEQRIVREEMVELLESDEGDFENLTLTLDEYKSSLVDEKEISIDGKMYDIKSVEYSGSHVKLIVVNDSKEEGILKGINNLTGRSNKQKDRVPGPLHQLRSLNYLAAEPEHSFYIPSQRIQTFFILSQHAISNGFDIATPPPEITA